jgi:alcohol dehydrogenase (cytochrome c)
MKKARISALLVSLILVAFLAAVAVAWLLPDARWRSQVIAHKLTGQLPDVELVWLLRMIMPGSPIYLAELASNPNPYAVIRNPRRSVEDADAGAELFRQHCVSCHTEYHDNVAISLFDGRFTSGDSDWAIFRNTIDGIDGTAMPPVNLEENSVWQIVAHIRRQSRDSAGVAPSSASILESITPITFERILDRETQPEDWLSYSGSVDGSRFTSLDQINKSNVSELKLAWVYQGSAHDHPVESTPLVVDGVMFTTEPPGSMVALNAENGRVLWRHDRQLPGDLRLCCGPVNRGPAVGGSYVFFGTLDAHLVALDIATGKKKWDIETARHSDGYSNTAAPIVIKNSVIVGVAGGEYGIRGFVDAYDIDTGVRLWRFNTIPAPGEPGSDSWEGDSWKTGGGPTWMTGSYDAETNLTFWGVGNPGPDFDNADRRGDNLYTNSVVALDADSGELQWHFQFTPEDVHDYDANSVPVIADTLVEGQPTKVLMMATKNGFYYLLDARTGRFLNAMEIARQTWARALDADGRPIRNPDAEPRPTGTTVYPGAAGGANWWPPAFDPTINRLYIPVLEKPGIFFSTEQEFRKGEPYTGGSSIVLPGERLHTVLRAIDPVEAKLIWEYEYPTETMNTHVNGTFATASGLVFWSNANVLLALDGESGELLWSANLGGRVKAAPMTYAVNGRQFVAVSAGRGLFVFSL